MAVIFVHGVNNRRQDPGYEARRLVTQHFIEHTLMGASINGKPLVDVKAVFPYWGDLAAQFAWNMKSLPSGEREALGPGVADDLRPVVAAVRDALEKPGTARDEPLITLARYSFPRAVDVLTDLVLQNAAADRVPDAAQFAIEAQLYAAKFEPPKPPPAWLTGIATDAQFCNQLLGALKAAAQPAGAAAGAQALGGLFDKIGNVVAASSAMLKKATQDVAEKVLDRTGDFASTKVLAWSRSSLNATLGRFFGDVFIYMDGRGDHDSPGKIPSLLLAEWDKAIAASPGEPLVIIGHSLGGVISYDLLTHFRPDLNVDLFVTVGSQVSHFEEMKLFKASRNDIPGPLGDKAPKPANIKHWINAFDEVDIFSYSCKDVFADVDDYAYDTKTYVVKAHGAYLEQARFYERLRARIDKLPVV
jgi:hypothetical protein